MAAATPETGFETGTVHATLLEREHVATGQVRMSLGVRADVRALHVHAGQFVELRPAGPDGQTEKGFFALLNAPNEGPALELLVRTDATSGGEAAALLMALPLGHEVPSSAPLGAGFSLDRVGARSVRVVATGTAIAPARAAIVTLLDRKVPVLSLDYGVRSPAHVALAAELTRFGAAGIDVGVHYSEPTEHGVVGSLAHHGLARRWSIDAPRREVVLAVGQPEMVRDVREHWVALGGDPLDVLSNY